MGDRVGLAEAIASLRAELYEAMTEGAGKLIKFGVGGVDLEFQTEVAREGGVNGKVRFWVVEAGASGTVTSTSTQTIKIHLEPIDAVTGTQVAVAETDEARPHVGGPTVATG